MYVCIDTCILRNILLSKQPFRALSSSNFHFDNFGDRWPTIVTYVSSSWQRNIDHA